MGPATSAAGDRAGSGAGPGRRRAIIVGHGWPSAPGAGEGWITALAARVRRLLPGTDVRGATLAADGALARAAAGACAPVVYPMFMADGWFVRRAIPRRLAVAGIADAVVAAPFGRHPDLPGLCMRAVAGAAATRGWRRADTAIVLAAHGSPSDPRPREVALAAADRLREHGGFASVACGFIDEDPCLTDVAPAAGQAICLPFFAAPGGHVTGDVPDILAAAGFAGVTLAPVGSRGEVPGIIAGAIAAALAGHLADSAEPARQRRAQAVPQA